MSYQHGATPPEESGLTLPVYSRRRALQILAGALGAALPLPEAARAQGDGGRSNLVLPDTHWNASVPAGVVPQKLPLLRLSDRPIVLETPRPFFDSLLTPNSAFFVRYHLDVIPNAIDLSRWRLSIRGHVSRPLEFSFSQLLSEFESVSVVAVNQCTGNSRSRFFPRVPGTQWGNGGMGNARWTGVRLMDLLERAGLRPKTMALRFQGLDSGRSVEGTPAHSYAKSLNAHDPILRECVIAYQMNGAPLPMLNGFPVRLVVPGRFSTCWIKHLSWIEALPEPDRSHWMMNAYRLPDNPRHATTPEEVASGKLRTVAASDLPMPVRSFFVQPDGSSKLVARLPIELKGIAFSGSGGIRQVEVSTDGGRSWKLARLDSDLGPYSFRGWRLPWTPQRPGRYELRCRAMDGKGNVQPTEPIWNPGGYAWNMVETQTVFVGEAA
ncbi:sulfite oxidase [Methylacidimicrobium cyclopophantes]|uniref:Sulfite oxidase n=1 Tax=Methylacidimicrobium cyclopophantes TaxID=1041766 RepID=A0A5E6MC21_9BACT|nr:molybdopterin-dependent oxidoreductase [Methylacidimicrobium cyclopophantes]VVM05875.1 sulfite oxidase [Methylacidimicrobium cyclopophantes]